jgi:dihydroflavonol-4-reductase
LRKEYDQYIKFPVPWSFTADVAACAIAALERGVRGERYLAFGTPDDVVSIPDFMNKACEIAGIDHHVHGLTGSELDDPAVLERYGPSIVALGRRVFPEPFFEYPRTVTQLDYRPVGLDHGLRITIDWLYEHGLV